MEIYCKMRSFRVIFNHCEKSVTQPTDLNQSRKQLWTSIYNTLRRKPHEVGHAKLSSFWPFQPNNPKKAIKVSKASVVKVVLAIFTLEQNKAICQEDFFFADLKSHFAYDHISVAFISQHSQQSRAAFATFQPSKPSQPFFLSGSMGIEAEIQASSKKYSTYLH